MFPVIYRLPFSQIFHSRDSPHQQHLHRREVLQSAPDGIKWTDLATVAGASGFVSTEFAVPVLTQWLRVPWLRCGASGSATHLDRLEYFVDVCSGR